MIQGYLERLRRGQLFTLMTAGFAAAAGSTLVGYSLLGAPLEYLLAATVMNAPAGLLMAKLMWPDSIHDEAAAEPGEEIDVRDVRDEESANVIDALGRGAMAGGRIAVTVRALLIAFVAVIALANGILGGVGGWFGADDLTFERILGWLLAPGLAARGPVVGGGRGRLVDRPEDRPQRVRRLRRLRPGGRRPVPGHRGGGDLRPRRLRQLRLDRDPDRSAGLPGAGASLEISRLGLRALLAGSLANLANAAIAGS